MIAAADLIVCFRQSVAEDWGYIYGMKHVMWTQARQNNYIAAYQGKDSSRQNSCRYGAKWIGHIVTDCSGLFAWWIEQLGGAIAHGSNSIYDRYCSAKGTLKNGKKSNGQELLPGTAVFTTGSDGRHGHIGLYVGNGQVIEAHGAKEGVIVSKVTDKSWKAWGELKMVAYDGTVPEQKPAPDPEPEPEPDEDVRPTLRKGSKGQYVKILQNELIIKGYSCGPQGADGDFGANTEKAVKAFQREHDGPDGRALTIDGVVGPATWWALESAPVIVTYMVTICNLTAEQKNKLMKEYPGATATPED